MGTTERLTAQMVFECIQDLHNRDKLAVRDDLASRFGVTTVVIDHHIKALLGADRIVKVRAGVYAPKLCQPQARAVSTTFLPNGFIKLEIGDAVLELTPYESKKVAVAMAGLATI